MIRKVTVRKNRIIIDWDKSNYNFFFRFGLQILADQQFKGKRKIIVSPVIPSIKKIIKEYRTIEVSSEFADSCVELAINQVLRDSIKEKK